MRHLPIALTVLLSALSVAAQAEHRVTVFDLPGMVHRGLKVIERGPHRYTTDFQMKGTITREVDGKGSIRTKSSNSRTGETGECVIIGDRIYHRSGNGPWISQTKDEFNKAQTGIAAGMAEARARKDTETFERFKGATINNLAIFFALWKPASTPVIAPSTPQVSDKTIAFIGNLPYKNKVASFYRFRMKTTEFTPPTTNVSMLETEILYAFDLETGALLKAETKSDWVYDSKAKTQISIDEWESDPSTVITPPVVEPLKH